MSHNGKVVLITGASSGIGKETAKTLIAEGYAVYAAARRVDQMKDLEKLGGIPVKMDVTSEAEMGAVVERIKRERGGVDILINNAGFAQYGPMEEISMDKARYQFEVNTISKAIKAHRPKTRYAVGSMAIPLMLMRNWLGDRIFDRVLGMMVR